MKKNIDFDSIAKRFFSINENQYISEAHNEKKIDRYYEIWTLKESYFKYKGYGLHMGSKANDMISYINSKDSQCSFFCTDIENEYKLAVCTTKAKSEAKTEVKLITLEQDNIIKEFLKEATLHTKGYMQKKSIKKVII